MPVTGPLGYFYGDRYGEWHTYGRPVFIGLIALHVAALLYHQFWRKDGLLMRMVRPEEDNQGTRVNISAICFVALRVRSRTVPQTCRPMLPVQQGPDRARPGGRKPIRR